MVAASYCSPALSKVKTATCWRIKRFVGKPGPSSADETLEGNGEMFAAGTGEASGEEGEAERARGVATGELLPPSEALGAMGVALLQVEGVEGEQM